MPAGHPLGEVLTEVAREVEYERIVLRGLDEQQVGTFLATSVGHAWPAGLVRRIHAETDGNPFYVREILRHLREQDRLPGQEALDSDRGAELGVPEGVRHVVLRRLLRSAPAASDLLRVASAFPGDFSVGVLRDMLELPLEADVLDRLDEAVRAGMLRSDHSQPGAYRFAHAIVRHAVYDQLGSGEAHACIGGSARCSSSAGRPSWTSTWMTLPTTSRMPRRPPAWTKL